MANDDQMNWQRQSMKKTGAHTLSVGSMHPKLNCGCAPVAKFADGGEVDTATLKAEGLAASNKEEPVGFFKRLSQGNIDDPKSEAYHEYGAGRGQRERNAKAASDESAAVAKVENEARATANMAIANAAPAKKDMGEFEGVDEAVERNKNSTASAPVVAPVKAKPIVKPVAAATPSKDARDSETGNGRGSRSFSADLAERKAATAVKPTLNTGGSDTSFDPMKINFASSKPAAKPAEEDKNKARTISRSRAYYSGKS
jgi:hypothetical protein